MSSLRSVCWALTRRYMLGDTSQMTRVPEKGKRRKLLKACVRGANLNRTPPKLRTPRSIGGPSVAMVLFEAKVGSQFVEVRCGRSAAKRIDNRCGAKRNARCAKESQEDCETEFQKSAMDDLSSRAITLVAGTALAATVISAYGCRRKARGREGRQDRVT
jgi:hypothetical protein